MRHIVTEIESISHLPPAASPALPPLPCRSPTQPCRPDQLLEDQETGEVTGGCGAGGDCSSTPPPSQPQSPSTPAQAPPDWPAGSVRRATKQLEQRLKQGLELAPAAPTPPPPPHHHLPRSPLHSPAAEHPRCPQSEPLLPTHGGRAVAQVQPAVSHADTTSKDRETPTESRRDPQRLDSPDPGPRLPPSNASSSQGPGARLHSDPTDSRGTAAIMSSDTSPQPRLPSPPSPRPPSPEQQQQSEDWPSGPLSVSGVTVQESDADAGPVPGACRSQDCSPSCDARKKLAHSSRELERIQETLRELQAFLHEGGPPEGEREEQAAALSSSQGPGDSQGSREDMDTEPDVGAGVEGLEEPMPVSKVGPRPGPGGITERQGLRDRQGKSFREPAAWRRTVALEARIRQAGLTPPSQMKRSASLAKLDCLELSANDLSDWDLRPPNRSPYLHARTSRPHPGPDDSWKKQRVLVQIPPAHQNLPQHSFQGDGCDGAAASPGPRREEETGEKKEEVGGRDPSPRHRRRSSTERKPHQQTATVLYNTM